MASEVYLPSVRLRWCFPRRDLPFARDPYSAWSGKAPLGGRGTSLHCRLLPPEPRAVGGHPATTGRLARRHMLYVHQGHQTDTEKSMRSWLYSCKIY